MSLVKRFSCDAGTFNIDEVMKGQSKLVYYDPLAQIALRPALRDGTIMCYKDSGVEGMFAEIQSVVGGDKRTVKANPFYWTEYCEATTLISTIGTAAAGAAGAAVTVALDKSSYSKNGRFSVPKKGYRAYIKELNQSVDITNTAKTVTNGHTVTLTPINGQILDLSKFTEHTLLSDTLRMYTKGDDACITGSGFVENPPTLRKGYVQKFEDMIPIHEDELDGYAYDKEFVLFKAINPLTGEKIDQWALPQLQAKLLERVKDNKNINTLFGERNDVTGKGFDGMIPTAESQGMFSRRYDKGDGVSLKAMLWNMIKSLRKAKGCKDYFLLHDFGFGMDWDTAIGALIKASEIGKNYQLFGIGGEGQRSFSWYGFNTFSAYGFKFTPKQIDAFDDRRYGAYLEDFALMMPACKFQDTNKEWVSPVTYVNVKGSEEAWNKTWMWDTREEGCRLLKAFVKQSYGMEIHCASKMGAVRGAKC